MPNLKARATDFYYNHENAIGVVILTAATAALIYGVKVQGDRIAEAIDANSAADI